MKRFSVLLISLLYTLSSVAENYPYRSDLLWVTVPDNPDWTYDTGEKATVDIQLYRYGIPMDGITVSYEIGAEMMPVAETGSLILKNGKARLDIGTLKEPGFKDCRLSVQIGGKTFRHHIKLGFSPEKILPYTAMPEDFAGFWQESKRKAAEFPLKYTIEPAPEYCTDKIDCSLVKIQLNSRGQAVYGYLFMPKGAQDGSHPIVLCPPGAGIKTIKEPLRHKYYAEEGCIRFEFEIHGLDPRMSAEKFKEISNAFNGKENGYLTNGLDERVTACVANHPALSDMAGYMAGRAGGYPHFFRTKGMDTPEKLRTMAYYDVVNFARLIKVPEYMTWGFNDDVCPPTTSYAVYNILSCPKEALITPINEHWTSEETEYGHLKWIQKNLK